MRSLKEISVQEWALLGVMIVLGVASRFYLAEHWNIKPVAAMFLFGGFFFRHWILSLIGITTIMFLSDLRLGLYDYRLMVSVYLSLALAILFGQELRRRFGLELTGWKWIPGFALASLGMSTSFFLLTNGACWVGSSFYSQDIAGLISCYVAGIPFFGRTLLGDFIFTTVFVGSYWLVLLRVGQTDSKLITAVRRSDLSSELVDG